MSVEPVSFMRYFEILEEHVGILLVPVNKHSASPRRIVSSEALYPALAQQTALSVYRENRCRSMASPLDLFPTLDALGALRYEVERQSIEVRGGLEFLETVGQATLSILEDT